MAVWLAGGEDSSFNPHKVGGLSECKEEAREKVWVEGYKQQIGFVRNRFKDNNCLVKPVGCVMCFESSHSSQVLHLVDLRSSMYRFRGRERGCPPTNYQPGSQ